MQHIVLITRENSERVTHASVYLSNTIDEAALFCRFINKLALKDDDKLCAKWILMNKEYRLEKTQPFSYEDLIKLEDSQIHRILQEVDSSVLTIALSGSSKEIKDKIFRIMPHRAGLYIMEDVEFGGPRDKYDIDIAKQMIAETYLSLKSVSEKEYYFRSTIKEYNSHEKDAEGDFLRIDYDRKKLQIVLVFSGEKNEPENILVTLFESEGEAYNYRDFINTMKTRHDNFYYARCAEQMVEYEIEKPLLVRFDTVFDFDEYVLVNALIKVGERTIVKALQGADAHTRERIIHNLPPIMGDSIRKTIEMQNKYPEDICFGGTWSIKRAQDAIVNAMNSVYKKMKSNG